MTTSLGQASSSVQRVRIGTWLPLIITLAIQAMVAMAVMTLPTIAPMAARALGTSPVYAGVYVAIVYAGATTASVLSGMTVLRFGAIRVSQVGLVLCAAGLALSTIPSLAVIAAGAFMIGLGYGPITPASSHILARTTSPSRMSLVFSIKQTGVPLGGVLAGAIVPGAALGFGWKNALLATAAANLASAAIAQVLRAELDADRDDRRPLTPVNFLHPIRVVWSIPMLRKLAVCSFVFSLAQLSLTSYLVTYLNASLSYTLVAAGLALSISQIGGIVGRIFWGWVADRWTGARRMLATLAALMAASALVTAQLQPDSSSLLVWAVLIVFGASAIGWNGVYLADVARQSPAGLAGVATGGALAFTFFGVVLGPPMFGLLTALFSSYRAGFAALAVPTAICCVVLLRGKSARPASS
jgi:MFS family permease